MMTQTYININKPIYLSYAWANDEHPNIEKDVDNLCQVLDRNGIFYKCGKNLSTFQSIIDMENEIAESKAIVVVLSKRYIQSLNCMHEWHLIRCNGNIEDRVFPILLENARDIIDHDVFMQYFDFFEKRKKELIKQQDENIIPLTSVELDAVNAGYYINDLTDMYNYLMSHNCEIDNYDVFIEQLKTYLKRINDNTSECDNTTATAAPHFSFSIPGGLIHRKNEEENLFNLVMQHRIVNLVGVGGSGKSSLAHLFMDTYKYDFNEIVYVVVNNHIKDEFVEQINAKLNLPNEADENVMYNKITAFLEENYKSAKPNLLVLDINETSDEIENKKFIEELHEIINNWDVLILSREHFIDCKTKNLNQIQDKEFMKELFLTKASDKYNSFEEFDGLFKFIDYSPLLAEQLGIYLKELPKKSLAEIKQVFYGEYFRDEEIEVGISAVNRQNSILSFLQKLIDFNKFKPNAQKLLSHFVLWQAEYIEYNVIKNLLKGVFASDDDYENALVALCKPAILTQKNLPDGNSSYKLHGLLAESLRCQIDISKQDYFKYLNNIENIIEYGYYDFIPFADCIGNSLCEYDIIANDYHLLNSVGIKFYNIWKPDYAKRLFEKYIAIAIKKVENNPNNSDYQNDLAIGYMNLALLQEDLLNDYTSAKIDHIKSIEISHRLPKDNPEYQYQLALAYNNLAVLQQDNLYDYVSAENNHKKSIKISERLPKDNPKYQYRLALAYYNLAYLQNNYLNDHKSAETNFKKAIEIKKQLPKDNPEYQYWLAVAYHNLANLQRGHLNDYKSAETNFKKAIEIKEQLPKNPVYQDSLALTYNNLALFYKDNLKKNDSAETYFKKAIETEEPLLEVNRRLFLINWVRYKYNLADLYFDTEKIEPAKSILEEIKPSAGECLAKNPNDEWTKTVNDSINELLEKINNSESAT